MLNKTKLFLLSPQNIWHAMPVTGNKTPLNNINARSTLQPQTSHVAKKKKTEAHIQGKDKDHKFHTRREVTPICKESSLLLEDFTPKG